MNQVPQKGDLVAVKKQGSSHIGRVKDHIFLPDDRAGMALVLDMMKEPFGINMIWVKLLWPDGETTMGYYYLSSLTIESTANG